MCLPVASLQPGRPRGGPCSATHEVPEVGMSCCALVLVISPPRPSRRRSRPWFGAFLASGCSVLPAPGGSLGSGLGPVLGLRAAGVRPGLLQAALTSQQGTDVVLGPGHPDRLVLEPDTAVGGGVGRPRLGDLGPHALLDLGRWPSTSAVIGGATSRSHRVASSGESVW